MAEREELYTDGWGAVIANGRHIEIHWTEKTADMTGDDFMTWLERFAGFVEASGSDTVLVDARRFRMKPGGVSVDWRDQKIIPRYNAAGVKKFAFVMPPGMPAIGTDPAPEGPADFPTAYFGDAGGALAWLHAGE